MSKIKVRIKKTPTRLVRISALMCLFALVAFLFCSCNVTRSVTTHSQYYQKGDTTCTIITKTIESYDATKKQ